MAQEAVGCGLVSSGTATWLEASPKQAASLAEWCVRAPAPRFAGVAIRADVRRPNHHVSYNTSMSRPPFSVRLDSVRLRRLDQAAEREGVRPSEFVRRALD